MGRLLFGKGNAGFYPDQKEPIGQPAEPHHFSNLETDEIYHPIAYSPVIAYILGSNMAMDGARCSLFGGRGLWLAAGCHIMTARLGILLTILALAVLNGVYSPRSFMIFALQGIWYPSFLPAPLTQMFILSGVISALLHLLVTGVPAALVERFVSSKQNLTMGVWLGAMLFPTYQTLSHLGWL